MRLAVLLTLGASLQAAQAQLPQPTADALGPYAAAVEKFVAASDPRGEAEARIELGVALHEAGRNADAWREVPRVLEAARRSGDPYLVASGLAFEAWLAKQTGERLRSRDARAS